MEIKQNYYQIQMGQLGSCFRQAQHPASTQSKPPPHNGSSSNQKQLHSVQKDRITDTDKAILDVKARMRKIKVYLDKMKLQVDQQQEKIKECLQNKQKERALVALKHKKFLEKELQKAEGAQHLMQQTINNIESAQMDIEVMEALKQGDQVITELQQKASLEDFEELYARHQEQQDRMKMEQDLFGEVLNDEELQDELDQLDADLADLEIPDAMNNPVEVEHAKKQQQQKPQKQEESSQRRQMVAA